MRRHPTRLVPRTLLLLALTSCGGGGGDKGASNGNGPASPTGPTGPTSNSNPFNPTTNVTLSGAQHYTSLNIPANVTVTVTGDLDLRVDSAATIAGKITGSCVKLRVTAGGALTATGNIANTCAPQSATPPDLRLVGKTFSFTNDTITAAGNVIITNDTTLPQSSPGALAYVQANRSLVAATGGSANQSAIPDCFAFGTGVFTDNGQDGGGILEKGANGKDAGSVIISCRGTMAVAKGTYEAGHGGYGGKGDGSFFTIPVAATGGNGGKGGQVILFATGAIEFDGFAEVRAGGGGAGGDAVGKTTGSGAAASAIGGAGGGDYAGNSSVAVVSIVAGGTMTKHQVGFDSFDVFVSVGGAGWGGTATASSGPGADATTVAAAQQGGPATATGGAAGTAGGTVVVQAGAGTALTVLPSRVFGTFAATGGDATAIAGKGGNGNALFIDAAPGGPASATGGNGSSTTVIVAGVLPGDGGNGGQAYVIGGLGGSGYPDCASGSATAHGGSGGAGGVASGNGGKGGSGLKAGTDGKIDAGTFGNGGGGGRGVPAGAGGGAGQDNRTGTKTTSNSFAAGVPGLLCPITQATTTWTVPPGGDPNGHFQFVNFQSIPSLSLVPTGGAALSMSTADQVAPATTPITITGASPWVTITGTIDASGTISAQGFGTVAGRSNVLVKLNGSITNGALSATVTAGDQVPQTLPGGKITYNVSGPAKSP